MAIGDAAAAAGLEVFPATQDKRLGYENDNYRGDEIAAEIAARVAAVSAEAAARIAGDALKFNAAKIIISASTPTVVTGAIWFKPV